MTEIRNPTVEKLEEELETLERRLSEATTSAQAASKRLQDIDRQKDELASGVFGGDANAAEEYKALEEEEREASRSLRVAQVAGERLRETVAETKEALSEARKDVHRSRYENLISETDERVEKIEEAATNLGELLGEYKRWAAEACREARFFDESLSDSLARYRPATREIRQILRYQLRGWLR